MLDLLPDGFGGLLDLPFPLFEALRWGLLVLGWEELPTEDRPPRAIWADQRALADHFAEVKRRNDEKYGGDGGGGAIEDPVRNDAARSLISG